MSNLLQKEIAGIVLKIVNIISDERTAVDSELKKISNFPDFDLAVLARRTELKIRRSQLIKIQKDVSMVLKTSSNHIILSTINPSGN